MRKDLNIGYNSRFGSDPSRQFPEEGMPIYEYRCEACGHKLETLQRLSDSRLTDCPVCGKSRLSKLVTAAGFQLKGSGWYATDFKGSGSKPAAAKTGSGESAPAKSNGGGAGAEAKAETKSESKVEAKSDSGTATGGGGCGGACSCH
jgi:putative FmdB family regulatory protein